MSLIGYRKFIFAVLLLIAFVVLVIITEYSPESIATGLTMVGALLFGSNVIGKFSDGRLTEYQKTNIEQK